MASSVYSSLREEADIRSGTPGGQSRLHSCGLQPDDLGFDSMLRGADFAAIRFHEVRQDGRGPIAEGPMQSIAVIPDESAFPQESV